MLPVRFQPPRIAPVPRGLFAATTWTDAEPGDPIRWLAEGVEFDLMNYGGDEAFGVWGADWCAAPDDLTGDDVKEGTRADGLDPFPAMTVWAFDACDLTAPSRTEVRDRAERVLRLREQSAVERQVAARLIADAGTPVGVTDIVAAVGALDTALTDTGTVGMIHAPAMLAASAADRSLIVRDGSVLRTPLGHRWVFGTGYSDVLEDTLVATSPTFGWRNPTAVREAIKVEWNLAVAIAERSFVVGYEAALGAATITP
ncbi:hypothetical protein H8Z58_29055 [Mycolicibacterium fortuitum]|nr:hypothetical protein [Mycolicibacterium fortuitum]